LSEGTLVSKRGRTRHPISARKMRKNSDWELADFDEMRGKKGGRTGTEEKKRRGNGLVGRRPYPRKGGVGVVGDRGKK